jgi:hypothetical protein
MFRFDGSDLGNYEWDVIHKFWIVNPESKITPNLIAEITLFDQQISVWMIRIRGDTDDCMIDELKPLFGLVKSGSHRIHIKGVPKIYNPAYQWLLPNGQINGYIDVKDFVEYLLMPIEAKSTGVFVTYPSLTSVVWYPNNESDVTPKHRKFFGEVQKVLLFRELFRVSTTDLDRIHIRQADEAISDNMPITMKDHHVRDFNLPFAGIDDKIARMYFPFAESKGKTLVGCLSLTKSNYHDQLMMLRINIENIIERTRPNRVWLANYAYEQMLALTNLYFSIVQIQHENLEDKEQHENDKNQIDYQSDFLSP